MLFSREIKWKMDRIGANYQEVGQGSGALRCNLDKHLLVVLLAGESRNVLFFCVCVCVW